MTDAGSEPSAVLEATGQSLSSATAGLLGDDGRFLPGVLARGADPEVMPEARAVEPAAAYARLHAPGIRANLEQAHGAPIRFEALAPCGPRYLANSAYTNRRAAGHHVLRPSVCG